MHKTPFQRQQVEGRKHPPFWMRFMLIVSSMGTLLARLQRRSEGCRPDHAGPHRHCAGQIRAESGQLPYQIERTCDAALHLQQFYNRHQTALDAMFKPHAGSNVHDCRPRGHLRTADNLITAWAMAALTAICRTTSAGMCVPTCFVWMMQPRKPARCPI
jgi:low-affinity inorganic phosphate transporter